MRELLVPGQLSGWYGAPWKSSSLPMQPEAWTRSDARRLRPPTAWVSLRGPGEGGAQSVSGSSDACGTPSLVMKAKLTGSMPALCRHCWFCVEPSTCDTLRLSIVNAAQYMTASQLMPGSQDDQPGG